jgi:hypothetical protein
MARITRYPPKAKPKYLHEVNARHDEAELPWLKEYVADIAGPIGFKIRKPNWGVRIFQFDTEEKAEAFRRRLHRWRHEEDLRDARKRPCPIKVRYEEAALAQHAVVWGLSTGVMREVIRTYRRERADCSTHGTPNWAATETLVAAAPGIDFDRGRLMVDAMLAYVIARHSTWFWTGLQGDRIINRY